MNSADEHEKPYWWEPLVEFAVHMFWGTGIFVIIFVAVLGPHYLLKWGTSLDLGQFVIAGLTFTKLFVFCVD